MTGHHGRPVWQRAQEVEHQAPFGVFLDPGPDRKSEAKQLRNKTPLGRFDRCPITRIVGVAKIWNRSVVRRLVSDSSKFSIAYFPGKGTSS